MQRAGQHQLLTGAEEKVLAAKIQTLLKLEAVHEEVKAALEREPTLMEWAAASEMETEDLREELNTARAARDRMINSNLRLVISIAKRYINRYSKAPFVPLNLPVINANEL